MNAPSPPADPRWDDRIPWNLRNPQVSIAGDVRALLHAIGQRLNQFLLFNESAHPNLPYFGTCLSSETLGHFHYHFSLSKHLPSEVQGYFDPEAIAGQADGDCYSDSDETTARELDGRRKRAKAGMRTDNVPSTVEVQTAELRAASTKAQRLKGHWDKRVAQRLATLEAIFYTVIRTGGNADAVSVLAADIRRFCAAYHVPLDIRGEPPRIIPMEERLLQESVIDPLLSRLEAQWPQRAKELVTAYHDMLAGKPRDEVFGDAFKSLEEIARSLTGNNTFEFSAGDLQRHFPEIHATIRATMVKLREHRGDEAAHGRGAPDAYEIRYLLFQVCNIALLLLDYNNMTAARARVPAQ